MKEAIEALPENFRIPVLLADVEGFSYKEIADIMDVPIGTVMSRLHRGRRALQKALYDFGLERGLVVEETNSMTEHDHSGSNCDDAKHTLYSFLDGELTDRTPCRDPAAPRGVLAVFRSVRFRG